MAQEFLIQSLKKLPIASIVAPSDFKLSATGAVNLEDYLQEHLARVSPYCIDLPRREVLFIETKEEIDLLTCKPFVYESQRLHGKKMVRVSFEELHQVAQLERFEEVIKPLFLYSTGRCGSTLLCNLMGDCADIVAISESDYFTQIPFLLRQYRTRAGASKIETELASITYDLTVLLLAHIRIRHPEQEVVFKLRSQCIEGAELIQCAFPDARHIFLYRDAIATVNSFCSVLSGHPLMRLASLLNSKYLPLLNIIPVGILNLLPFLRSVIGVMAPLSTQLKFAKVGVGAGAGVFVLAWLSVLDKVLRLQYNDAPLSDVAKRKPFFSALLRYEELQERPLAVTSLLLKQLDLPTVNEDAEERMKLTLLKDSQQGSELASTKEYVLNRLDEQLIARAIQAHGEVNSGDYQLPGSIQV